jgi:broad specificity phosphatase PhoE
MLMIDKTNARRLPWLPLVILIALGVIIVVVVGYFCFNQPITTVFVLRHADRANGSLSVAGQARAQKLVHVVGEAGVTAIYSTQTTRTEQTAQPLATHLSLSIDPYTDPQDVVAQVFADHRGEVVFVVGHSNTVGLIVEEFGADPIDAIAGDEYDNLFVVTIPGNGKARALHLNYGEPD